MSEGTLPLVTAHFLCIFLQIHYDDDYQGDAPAVPVETDQCPPVPDVTTEEVCREDKCQSDTDCAKSYRCCFNGCVFTCLVEVQPAPGIQYFLGFFFYIETTIAFSLYITYISASVLKTIDFILSSKGKQH